MWLKRTPQKILAQANARAAVVELLDRIDLKRSFDQLSKPEQKLVLLSQLRSETLNGTVEQYLTNSSGDNFSNALSALEEIGASECVRLLREVTTWFPDGFPHLRDDRCIQLFQIQTECVNHEANVRRITDQLSEAFPAMLDLLVLHLQNHLTEIK